MFLSIATDRVSDQAARLPKYPPIQRDYGRLPDPSGPSRNGTTEVACWRAQLPKVPGCLRVLQHRQRSRGEIEPAPPISTSDIEHPPDGVEKVGPSRPRSVSWPGTWLLPHQQNRCRGWLRHERPQLHRSLAVEPARRADDKAAGLALGRALAPPIGRRETMLREARGLLAAAALLGVLVGAGATARFVGLGTPFWYHDEATTSLRISGYGGGDVQQALSDRVSTVSAVLRYQSAGPRGLRSTIKSLAREDPQHPPLFYVVARAWAGTVGDSIVWLRLLAALLGLLTLPAVYWLVRELFGRGPAAWIAVALVAVSPFEILFAQVAREYGLWAALTAAGSAALLRASRRGSTPDWALYAALLAASFLTYPLAIGVAAGHALFVTIERVRGGIPSLLPFASSMLAAGAAFAPWAYVMLAERGALAAGTRWANQTASIGTLAKAWLVEIGLPLVDNAAIARPFGTWTAVLALATLTLVVAALVSTVRFAPRRATVFLASLLATTTLPLVGADLATGGIRSTVPRFLVPALLVLEVPIAFLIASLTRAELPVLRAAAASVAAFVLAGAVGSFAARVGAPVWWTHDDGAAAENVAVSRLVDTGARPALVTTSAGNLLELAHYLRPAAAIFLASGRRLPPADALRGRNPIIVYGSAAGGDAAARLSMLLRLIRGQRDGRLVPLDPQLPCCGAGIRQEPGQLWLWLPSPRVLRR